MCKIGISSHPKDVSWTFLFWSLYPDLNHRKVTEFILRTLTILVWYANNIFVKSLIISIFQIWRSDSGIKNHMIWRELQKPKLCGLKQSRQDRERRKTLGHLRSINRNMIIHFANQSQTCQLLNILKNFFFSNFSWKETVKSGAINPWLKIHIDYQECHINIYVCVEFLA